MIEYHQVSFLVVHRLKELALVATRCHLFLVDLLWMIFDLLNQRPAVFFVFLPEVQPQFYSPKVRQKDQHFWPSTLSGEVTVTTVPFGAFPLLADILSGSLGKTPEKSPPNPSSKLMVPLLAMELAVLMDSFRDVG